MAVEPLSMCYLSAADKPLRWAHAHTCNSRHHYPVVEPTAHAESATFYGRDGSYQGSAFTYGNQRTFTNNRGEFTGSSITTATRRHFTIATAISGARSRGRALQPIIR